MVRGVAMLGARATGLCRHSGARGTGRRPLPAQRCHGHGLPASAGTAVPGAGRLGRGRDGSGRGGAVAAGAVPAGAVAGQGSGGRGWGGGGRGGGGRPL
jgi:hypothetical protein